MGRSSREIYEECFKVDVMAAKTESLIKMILQKNKNWKLILVTTNKEF